MRGARLGLLVGWLGLVAVVPVRAQEAVPADAEEPRRADVFEATGVAALGADPVKARERALSDGMQRAVEQAVVQAAPEARGRLYIVSGRSRSYVSSYRVLGENESGGQLQLRLAAQVDLPRLLRDLRPAGEKARGPGDRAGLRLCAALSPATTPGTPGQDALQGAALTALREGLSPLPVSSGACPTGDALALALTEVTLVEPATPVRGTAPPQVGARARVTLALRGPGAAEAHAESYGFGEGAEAAQRDAAGRAAAQALGEILPRLRGLLPPAPGEAERVTVALDGVPSARDLQTLTRTLAALPGVQGVERRRFAVDGQRRSMDGAPRCCALSVEVQVGFGGGAAALGALLGRTPLPGLRVQVMPPEGARLPVLVVSEQALPAAPDAPPGAAPGTTPAAAPSAPPLAPPPGGSR